MAPFSMADEPVEPLVEWAQSVLGTAEVLDVRRRPWSLVVALGTPAGAVVYAKAAADGGAHEPLVLSTLAGLGATCAVLPIDVDVDRGWVLLPDAGDRHDRLPLPVWQEVVVGYAAAQRATEPAVADLLAGGVPDRRPATLTAGFAEIIGLALASENLPLEQVSALHEWTPFIERWCGQLDAAGIAPTIDHNDLHPGNVGNYASATGIFDWGDSCIAHPWGSLMFVLAHPVRNLGLGRDAPEVVALRQAYLSAWGDVDDSLAEIASCLGHIPRMMAWLRLPAAAHERFPGIVTNELHRMAVDIAATRLVTPG